MWGQSNRWRSPEILFTLLVPGHRIDAVQAVAFNTFATARRVLHKRPHLWPTYCEVHELRARCDPRLGGPVKALLEAAKTANATLLSPGEVQFRTPHSETDTFNLVGGDTKRVHHQIREALRAEQFCLLEDRRDSFEGIAYNGVDRKATSVIVQNRCCGLDKYYLRCIQTGAVPSMDRLWRSKLVEDPSCPCCGAPKEDWRHIIDSCPAYEHLRVREMPREAWDALPTCLRAHGIVPCRLDDYQIPEKYLGDSGPAALAAYVQYVLLDCLKLRAERLGSVAPRPRW